MATRRRKVPGNSRNTDKERDTPAQHAAEEKWPKSKTIKTTSPQIYSKRAQKIMKNSYSWNIIGFIILFGLSYYLVDYLTDIYDESMASHDDEITRLFVDVPCSKDYGTKFKGCTPKRCGRCVMDNLFDEETTRKLRGIAEKGMAHGRSNGGASVLDLHSGALSKADKFVNIYRMPEKVFADEDFQIYTKMKDKIHETIAKEFEIPKSNLYLTNPTFFSRMDSRPAKTKHDEYWHPHIDKITYKTFYYTSLLYLSEYGRDFMGGRFTFIDKRSNKTVEPRMGRLSFFTSGSENPHFVEKVVSGQRFAITVSFTCDPKAAIKDPGQ